MTFLQPLLDILQQASGSSPPTSPPPFSILQMGKALFTLSVFTAVTGAVVARALWGLTRGGPEQREATRRTIDLGLFWGALTLGAGVFHALMSLISTSYSVQIYGPIGPEQQWMVARGVMLALLAAAYGVLVFMLTALVWLGLRRWHGKLVPVAT